MTADMMPTTECEYIGECKHFNEDSVLCFSKLKYACSHYHYRMYWDEDEKD